MFVVVDASVWVARLVSQDVFYEPVKKWMSTRLEANDQFLAPSLLLAEIGGAISRRTSPSDTEGGCVALPNFAVARAEGNRTSRKPAGATTCGDGKFAYTRSGQSRC